MWLLSQVYFKLGKHRSTIRCLEELTGNANFKYRKDALAWLQGLQDA